METEVVKASELQARVVQRIFEIRHPEVMAQYRRELATFKRRTKAKTKQKATYSSLLGSKEVEGYFVQVYDQLAEIKEPKKPAPYAFAHTSYDRGWGGIVGHATQDGVLIDSLYNRDIRPARVDEYCALMRADQWHDLFSDPIAITENGQVVNGQHRIAAATRVDWSARDIDPSFLVVWGVDATEALHADGSRRTANDEKVIGAKLVRALSA